MPLTKPQRRLIDAMQASGQLVHYLHGGGWRLFDGTPVHRRTIESLASRGVIVPAANDLLGDTPAAYQVAELDDGAGREIGEKPCGSKH